LVADRSILLVGVESPYAEAIGAWCTQSDVIPLYSALDDVASSASHRLSLCVLQVSAGDSLDPVPSLAKLLRQCPLIVLARDLGADAAFRLSRAGVTDLIELPRGTEEVVARTVGHLADSGESQATRALVGESPPIRELKRQIHQAASNDSKVLLQGETGTGKGLVARQIHERSRRAKGPFVHVDCAALSPNLIESELFGHEKGAFTGADSLRRGRFEAAGSGTIFLDEIGDLDAPLQSKLLRVLEDFVYERVGGTRSLPMTARVIAATSHDLFNAVRRGHFRRDLYYRLSVLSYEIPPLRERPGDIPLLVQSGLERLSGQLVVATPRVGDDFYEALTDHSWPGNVRELMNLLERVLVQTRAGVLRAADLEGLLDFEPPADEVRDAPSVSEDDESAMIRAALIDTGGNVTRAARRMDIPRGTLRYKIRRYGLDHLIPDD
jgi:DNA-binding NtrC family response regulator